jgi:hypothetical protein
MVLVMGTVTMMVITTVMMKAMLEPLTYRDLKRGAIIVSRVQNNIDQPYFSVGKMSPVGVKV